MSATRTSVGFFLRKTAVVILLPFAAVDAALFWVTAYQQGMRVAGIFIAELATAEIALWLAAAITRYVQRSTSDRFRAMQDEIEELKERISMLETSDTGEHASSFAPGARFPN